MIIKIKKNIHVAQSKGSMLFVQIRGLGIWVSDLFNIGKCLRIRMFAPRSTESGYVHDKFSFNVVEYG